MSLKKDPISFHLLILKIFAEQIFSKLEIPVAQISDG
jgi:hypothetical protein